jgi:transketolase
MQAALSRVSVDAGVSRGWKRSSVTPAAASAPDYGAPADCQTLYQQFGITAAGVAAAARDSIHDAQNGTRPAGRPATFAPAAGSTADRPA